MIAALRPVALFGDAPRTFCDIAVWDGEPMGFALWFYGFSTFARGRHGLDLEDLYVHPEHHGRGLGRAPLARLARLARLDWSVLDWNIPTFYHGLGAVMLDGWTGCRLDGAALARLAAAEPQG